MTVEGATINVYDKERMLIELIRNKNQIAFDYYKEIISNYRKIINDLDISKIEEYIEIFPHEEHIYETVQREVLDVYKRQLLKIITNIKSNQNLMIFL